MAREKMGQVKVTQKRTAQETEYTGNLPQEKMGQKKMLQKQKWHRKMAHKNGTGKMALKQMVQENNGTKIAQEKKAQKKDDRKTTPP